MEVSLWTQGADEGTALWVLKADVHRGQGLHFAPALEAAHHARLPRNAGGADWVVSQRFVADQYLVADRPFYLRWAHTDLIDFFSKQELSTGCSLQEFTQ